jgi:hypothetical protein
MVMHYLYQETDNSIRTKISESVGNKLGFYEIGNNRECIYILTIENDQ